MNDTPDSFEDLSTTATDPALDALLDESLAAGDAPAGLEQRVLAEVRAAREAQGASGVPRGVAAQSPGLGRSQASQARSLAQPRAGVTGTTAAAGSPVLARIGFVTAFAAAAALAIGTALVALWATAPGNTPGGTPAPGISGTNLAGNTPGGTQQTTPDTDPGLAPAQPPSPQLAALETDLAALADDAVGTGHQADELDDQIVLLDTQLALTASESLWLGSDPWESAEIAAMQSDLDALAFPLDAAF